MSANRTRWQFMDFAKGLAAILMVLGHAEIFFDPLCFFPPHPDLFFPSISSEVNFWIYVFQSSVDAFYFCAGIALGMKVSSSLDLMPIRKKLIRRGVELIAIDLTIISWAYSDPGTYRIFFGSIASFGASFIIMALFISFRPTAIAALAIGILIVREILVIPEPFDYQTALKGLYGVFWSPVVEDLWTSQFVVLCWLPIIMLGYCYGYLLRQSKHLMSAPVLLSMASALMLIFIVLRFNTRFGSLGQALPTGWLQAFALSKYPAGIQFHLLNMSFCLFYLGLGRLAENGGRLDGQVGRNIVLLGRCIFFVYLAHEIMFGLIKNVFDLADVQGSLTMALFIFAGSLLLLTWMSKLYEGRSPISLRPAKPSSRACT